MGRSEKGGRAKSVGPSVPRGLGLDKTNYRSTLDICRAPVLGALSVKSKKMFFLKSLYKWLNKFLKSDKSSLSAANGKAGGQSVVLLEAIFGLR